MRHSHKILYNLQLLLIFLFSLTATPAEAEANKFVFEAYLYSEAEWDFKESAACVNQASLYAEWHPVAHSYIELGTIHTYSFGNEQIIDDLQGFSNIQDENSPFNFCVLNYGYKSYFGADSTHFLKLNSGIRNVNEDYFFTGTSTLFLNSSDGIYPTIGANYEMANFPLSGVCPIHLVYMHKKGIGAKFSLYNGIAGKTIDGTGFRFRPKKDGITTMSEVFYTNNNASLFSLYSLGLTTNNSPSENSNGVVGKKNRATGWAYVEQGIFKTRNYNCNILLQGSSTFSNNSICRDYAGAGITLCKTEPNDKFGVENMGLMNHYAKYSEGTEWSQEVILQIRLLKYLSLKPSVQFIENKHFQKVGILRLCYEVN